MNTRRKAGGEIEGAATGVIQVPSHAPAIGKEMHVNPAGLKDGEVRTTLVQVVLTSTLKAQAIGFDGCG